jgi:hypothetical protein
VRRNILNTTSIIDRISGLCFGDPGGNDGGGMGGGGSALQPPVDNSSPPPPPPPLSPPVAPPPPPVAPPPAPTGDDWRTKFVGDNTERLEQLKAFETEDAMFARLNAPTGDWETFKKAMAGDDTKALEFLNRFADPQQAFKAWQSAQAKLTEGGKVKIPDANATPEELAAYNKAIGLPEKVEDYKITAAPPKGYEPTDYDKSALTNITNRVHEALGKGAKPNDIVNFAHQLYYEMSADAAVKSEETAADLALETEREMRQLWGDAAYDNKIALGIAGAKKFFPVDDEAEFERFMGMKLESGHALFDHPLVQRMFAQIGLQHVEDPYFLAAATGKTDFDPAKRIAEIHRLRTGTGAEQRQYAELSKPGGELERLTAGLARNKGRS